MNSDKLIPNIIKSIIGKNKCIYPDAKEKLKELVNDTLYIFFPNVKISDEKLNNYIESFIKKDMSYSKISEIIDQIVEDAIINYNMIKQQIPNFDHNDVRDKFYRLLCDQIIIPNNSYLNCWKQYKKIESLPQPEQKSPEWFAMRNNFITASAGAQAIGESKYEKPIELLKHKIGLGKPFGENFNVHHGKKFEKIAILIYENIYNIKVGEFGLVPHISIPNVPFLGASPDGICTCSTLDGKFSSMVGRMLEIKCTTSRIINTQGLEDGEICPHYYWVQVQLQLECCDLEDCDFWQCKLKDYWSKDTWNDLVLDSDTETNCTEQQNIKIDINDKFKYGTLIELIPIKMDTLPDKHKIEWYGKYIYPTELNCSLSDKVKWAENMRKNWKEIYPEYIADYKFARILYWHLEKSHCYLIKRDREWFKNKLPKFQEFWDQVEMYKNNPDMKQKLIDEIADQEAKTNAKKYTKIETKKPSYADMFDSD